MNFSTPRASTKRRRPKRLRAWSPGSSLRKWNVRGISKATLAEKMHTSRAQVDRILKAKGNITIDTLQRAAARVGREPRLELI